MSTTDSEEWRPVVGWERGYSISSLGRVRRDLASPKTRVGRILTPSWGGGRGRGQYKCVRLSIDNVARTCRIASMVMAAFVGPVPPGMEIDHVDGNVTNNAVTNLEYVTALEQQRRASRLGLKAHGEGSARSKLTDAAVLSIRASSRSVLELAAEHHVSKSCIRAVLVGETWRHLL